MKLSEKLYNFENNIVISLDGPSASGKGMVGNMLAQEFKLVYFQSSLVYRGLAYICLKNNISENDIDSIIRISAESDIISEINNIDLNIEKIGSFASKISVIVEVRNNLGRYLKSVIESAPRIIMEGRDIGTIIAPNADLKIFITADIDVRVERRYKQLLLEGKNSRLSDVLSALKERDERDSSRKEAPLLVAKGALVLDTTELTPQEVLQNIKNFVDSVS